MVWSPKAHRKKMMDTIAYSRRRLGPEVRKIIGRVGGNLKLAIKGNFAQASVATKAGLDPAHLSNIMHGKVEPGIKTILVLEIALGLKPGDLLRENCGKRTGSVRNRKKG